MNLNFVMGHISHQLVVLQKFVLNQPLAVCEEICSYYNYFYIPFEIVMLRLKKEGILKDMAAIIAESVERPEIKRQQRYGKGRSPCG